MERVLLIDNYDSFTYNLVHYIETNSNYQVDVFRNDKISLEDVGNYDTIVLSPGPGLPKDAGILLDVINTFSETKKILGVCLGMQAITEAFGGNLINLDTVLHGVSTPININSQGGLLFKNLPLQFNVGRYHSWIVDENNFPEELSITSKDENNQIMALEHKKYKLYGVQFHPESILTQYGKEIITNFLSI